MPNLRPLGLLKSVTDRHAELTIVGDVTDQSVLLEDEEREGMVVTLSIAAHHRQLRSRLRVKSDEAAAWIATIIGEEWADRVHAAGALSTTANSQSPLTTQFFYVFVGRDGRPQESPAEFNLPLRPLGELRKVV